jgi:hypothetical protein
MTKPLDDSNVPVSVNVTVNKHGVATCTCSPSPAPVTVPNSTITFTLTAPVGWEFPDAGAVVVPSPADQFPDPSVTQPGNLVATLFDVNSDTNEYTYTVHVQQGSTKVKHDPLIKNGGISMGGPGD